MSWDAITLAWRHPNVLTSRQVIGRPGACRTAGNRSSKELHKGDILSMGKAKFIFKVGPLELFHIRGPYKLYKWLEVSHNWLAHWGRVTHICVSNLTLIGSDNGLSLGRCQAITWTYAGKYSTVPLGTNFDETQNEIHTPSFNKMHLKLSSTSSIVISLALMHSCPNAATQNKFMNNIDLPGFINVTKQTK